MAVPGRARLDRVFSQFPMTKENVMNDRRRFIKNSLCASLPLALASYPLFARAGTADVRLGVVAQRSFQVTESRWGELARYLTRAIGAGVEIVPVEIARAYSAVVDKKVDLFLANPNQTVILKHKQNARLLASMVGKDGPMFGGVILAKKGGKIQRVEDLRANLVAALGRQSAGGYLFQAHHTARKGLRPRRDYGIQLALNQDEAVHFLQQGKASAAFIRSGILETMEHEGKIAIDDFIVLDERKDANFPLRHTTELYPEHFMLALPHFDTFLAENVKKALIRLSPAEPAAHSAAIKGFVEPISTASLEAVMRALQAPPFEKA